MYAGESPLGKLMDHQSKPIPSLHKKCPAVSSALDAVFAKMVAKIPADRYQSMAEVIVGLERCCEGSIGVVPLEIDAAEPGITTTLRQTQADTDPRLEQSLPGTLLAGLSHAASDKREPGGRWWENRNLLIASGSGGLLLVLLGICVIVRDKDGSKLGGSKVPDGGAATARIGDPLASEAPDAGSKSAIAAGPAAPILSELRQRKTPFDGRQAKAYQEAWARQLGTRVETTNSVGAKMILIPPGNFLMGSTDEQLAAAIKAALETGVDQLTKDRVQRAAPASGRDHQAVPDERDGSHDRPVQKVRNCHEL